MTQDRDQSEGRASTVVATKRRPLIVSCVILTALATAGCKTTSVNSTAISTDTAPGASSTNATNPAPTTSTASTSAPTATAPVAHVGSVVKVSDGTQAASVTLVKVIDPATGADQYTTPNTGDRFVGVEISINSTNGTVTGDANSDLLVIGSDNQTYTADFDSIAGCTNFNNGEFTVTPGDTNTGCVTYQIPTGVTVSKVQFIPGGGMLPGVTAGQWLVP